MLLQSPIIITPRLLAGVEIGGSWLSIRYDEKDGDNGRIRYRYYFDPITGCNDNKTYTNNNLQSGCQGENLQYGLELLLSFLCAAGELFRYEGEKGEHTDLFPLGISKWAAENMEEIELLRMELQEKSVIEE